MNQTNNDKAQAVISWAVDKIGCPYVYGATGANCSPKYRRELTLQYPDQAANIAAGCQVLNGKKADCAGCAYLGKPCFDCAQFTRRALEQAGFKPPSGASSQWRSSLWEHKGRIGPEAGSMLCLVFCESGDKDKPMKHVGLSLGDGRVIDARNHLKGVVLSHITAYPWTQYAALPPFPKPELISPGDREERVKGLQTLLMARGFSLPAFGADGAFGLETLAALHTAQETLGLPRRDQADEQFLKALAAPPQTKEEVTEEAEAARPGPEERLRRLEEWMEQIEQRLKEMVR